MKKILVLLLCLLTFGCGQKVTQSREDNELGEREIDQQFENSLKENINLLAAKYGIDTDRMLNIISDYEELISGESSTRLFYNLDIFVEKTSPKGKETARPTPEIVDISTAINTVSNKYQIPKGTIASIMLDKKMLERCENE